MRPYPWKNRERFQDRTKIAKFIGRFYWPLLVVSLILSPLTLVMVLWSFFGFVRANDRWYKRGLIMMGLGVVLTLALFRGGEWFGSWNTLLTSFGEDATTTWQEPATTLVVQGIGPSFIVGSLAALITGYRYEWGSRKYLDPTRPTVAMKVRKRRNTNALASGMQTKGFLRFGVIVDDEIPWRTPRHGMVAERPLAKLGHGCITGANGTGKTIAAMTMAYYGLCNDASLLFIDCKGSIKTKLALKSIAERAGVPFLSFDTIRTGPATDSDRYYDGTWYDPLDWDGTPSEKSSMLMGSFSFSEDGGSQYYTNQARSWLTLQFEVMDQVGIQSGESRFDFLLETTDPSRLKKRYAHFRDSKDTRLQNMFQSWNERVSGIKAGDLSGLRANLESVVNAAGARLRSSGGGKEGINLRSLGERGSVIYIGLSAVSDDTALKVLGSLAIKDISVFAGERFRDVNSEGARDILVMTDEASRLKDRTVVMDNLFTLAREANMWVWPITQTFSTWPDSTVTEMTTNALTQVVCRVPDQDTAVTLVSTLGTKIVMSDMAEEKTSHRAFRSEEFESMGENRSSIEREPFLRADQLTEVPDHHAYVWFTGTWTRPTKRKWVAKRLPKKDENLSDAPLVQIVPPSFMLEAHHEAQDSPGNGFKDNVIPVDDLISDEERQWNPSESLTEAQRRRMEEFRARQSGGGQAPIDHGDEGGWDEVEYTEPVAPVVWTPEDSEPEEEEDDTPPPLHSRPPKKKAAPAPAPQWEPVEEPAPEPEEFVDDAPPASDPPPPEPPAEEEPLPQEPPSEPDEAPGEDEDEWADDEPSPPAQKAAPVHPSQVEPQWEPTDEPAFTAPTPEPEVDEPENAADPEPDEEPPAPKPAKKTAAKKPATKKAPAKKAAPKKAAAKKPAEVDDETLEDWTS